MIFFVSASDAGEYKHAGQMLSVALVHGSIMLSSFSEHLYCCVSRCPTPEISIEEADDWELSENLQWLNITSSIITGWDKWQNIYQVYLLKICSLNVLFLGIVGLRMLCLASSSSQILANNKSYAHVIM